MYFGHILQSKIIVLLRKKQKKIDVFLIQHITKSYNLLIVRERIVKFLTFQNVESGDFGGKNEPILG